MANQVPEFQSQVQLNAVTTDVPYAQTFDSMALTPTALGEFGSKLAITASTTLAQMRGYDAGLNPSGSILPPITQTDKAFAEAYITQSQNTLGLQATKLMQEGQAELSRAWKLTPEMLSSYTKNMSEGLNDIINNAPMQAQPGLATQLTSNLQSSTFSLHQKMITQQKQQSLQNATMFNAAQLSSIYEAARGGNLDSAKKMADDMIARSQGMASSGMYSPLQAETARKSAQNSLYTGLYSGEAIKAFNNKTSDQYLSDLLQKKPEGMSTLEWEGVARNVMGEVQLYESFQQRNETSLYSEGNRLLNEGALTPDFIAQLESETTSKPRFNDFMSKLAVFQRKNYATNDKVSSLIPNWTQSDSMAVADNKTKNMALAQAARDVQQRAANSGRTLDDFQAQAEAMSTAGGPVQTFTQQMNAGLLSGNPALMLRNLGAYRALKNSNAKVLNGVTPQAQAMMTNFESQLENGNAPDVAAAKAYEVVQQKTPEQMEINTALVKQWETKTVDTPSRLNSWASQFAEIGDGAAINNLPYFAIHVKNIFKSNMEYLNGDIEGATKMTQEGIERSWGVTEVNGKREFVFQPIEKTIDLDSGANPLIKYDLYEQLQKQIEPMNAAYDEGIKNKDTRMSFKYQLEPRPTYDEFLAAQKVISKKGSTAAPSNFTSPLGSVSAPIPKDSEFDEAISTVKRFKDENIKIKRVYTGGHVEEFEIAIAANPGLQQDAKGIIGSYNISMRKNNGPSAPMNGWFRGPLSEPVYMPNQAIIRNRYFEMVGLNSTGESPKEVYQKWLEKRKLANQPKNRVLDNMEYGGRFAANVY